MHFGFDFSTVRRQFSDIAWSVLARIQGKFVGCCGAPLCLCLAGALLLRARLGSGLTSSASFCLWAGLGSAGLRCLPGSGLLFFPAGFFGWLCWVALLLLVLLSSCSGLLGAVSLGWVFGGWGSGVQLSEAVGGRTLSLEFLPRMTPRLRLI